MRFVTFFYEKPDLLHHIFKLIDNHMSDLSQREKQILKMLLAEYSQNEISTVLNLSYSRVNDVKSNIMNKWRVTTMVGLVKESIRQGYLEIEDWDLSNP